MTTREKESLNTFFVSTFNKILAYEEKIISHSVKSEITVREMHVAEVVGILEKDGKSSMSNIANALEISVGALSTCINVMVKKGYVTRLQNDNDRRVIFIKLTETGTFINQKHREFHIAMINDCADLLDKSQMSALVSSLEKLSGYFGKKIKEMEIT